MNRRLLSYLRSTRVLLLCGAFRACGGAKSTAESVEPSEPIGPGAECLAAANAPRDRSPEEPASIEVSHILVRHAQLERPQGATLTREEACLKALEALEAVQASGDWDQTVADFSDSGVDTQGDLGRLKRADVTARFADAAFALQVDQLSYVVETDRGFHIILRTR